MIEIFLDQQYPIIEVLSPFFKFEREFLYTEMGKYESHKK